MSFAIEKTPRISLGCKLVPVAYQKYENAVFSEYYNLVPTPLLSGEALTRET